LLLLTLLIKAKIRITAFLALGLFLLLQTLVFLAVSGELVLAPAGEAFVASQKSLSTAA
jgi:hypothetical protein